MREYVGNAPAPASVSERWSSTDEIAKIRGIPAGEASISPNGHPDIRSVEDMLDMIVTSVAANGGRSCINASGVRVATRGREIARDGSPHAERTGAFLPGPGRPGTSAPGRWRT